MMKKSNISNYGNGIIVNESTTGAIVMGQVPANMNDFERLTAELEILLKKYRESEKEDENGIKNIEKAIEFSRKKDDIGLKAVIRKCFSTYMKDFVKDLSLHLLLAFTIDACK